MFYIPINSKYINNIVRLSGTILIIIAKLLVPLPLFSAGLKISLGDCCQTGYAGMLKTHM